MFKNRLIIQLYQTILCIDSESPIKGKVVTETFLGNITNYFIQLGDKQIRLQQSALDVMKYGKAKEGQEVGLKFVRKFYYEKEEA